MHLDLVVDQVDRDVALVQEIIGEVFLDQETLVAEQDHEFVETEVRIALHDVPQDGLAADFNHRLRTHIGLLAETRSQATCKNHNFHKHPQT